MKRSVSKKEKRRILLFIMLFLGIVVFMCFNVFPDLLKIMNNKNELKNLELSYNTLLDKEQSLQAEVKKLQDPLYIERYAKENYYYTKPNDIIIRIPGTN